MIPPGFSVYPGGPDSGMPLRRLAVFFKNPVAGQVKTRLARRLGDEQALTAYRAMAADLLSNLEPLRDIVVPFFDSLPAEGSGLFPENYQPGTDAGCSGIRLQQGGDLGERMAEAFRELFAEGADEVLLIGSDIPQIDSFLIAGYFQALQAYDVVIGPAADGGYYLIGFTRKSFEEDLFERIDWSTERVYRQTLERARKQGLSVHSGRTLRDIDTYEDLESLVNQRNAELYLYDLVRLFLQRKGA